MVSSAQRISAGAYQALRNALALVFWYKSTLKKYLHAALRDHPELLASLDFDTTKREVADALVDRLIQYEGRYQQATVQLMIELGQMERFPELESHEDSEKWLPRAEAAVAELKRWTIQHENLIGEREKIAAERAAYEQQVMLQRKFADEIRELYQEFMSMHSMADKHERGRRFEGFLNSLFELFDLQPRLSYSMDTEQIDGAFSFDTDDYIVEAKWLSKSMSREQADAFASKVTRKGKNALGLIVSVNGISGAAIQAYSRGTPFVTMEGIDLMHVLEGRIALDDLLRQKKRHANETGECYFPANRMI